MTWTYYKQVYPNQVWVLFRAAAGRPDEVFHRQRGWIATDELYDRRRKGDIDAFDIIPEADADALLRTLPDAHPGLAPDQVPGTGG